MIKDHIHPFYSENQENIRHGNVVTLLVTY
jgi:hypothetical protein